ncbi:MAG: hypothetical protein H7A45_20765 [Verrucomicrobiales bacterium]|nr:hypothetical protein [Verrucomicrobiales bacterium]
MNATILSLFQRRLHPAAGRCPARMEVRRLPERPASTPPARRGRAGAHRIPVHRWAERSWTVGRLTAFLLALGVSAALLRAQTPAEVERLSVNGEAGPEGASLVIKADLKGPDATHQKLIYATRLEHTINVQRNQLAHAMRVEVDVIQGRAEELSFPLLGKGTIREVNAAGLRDWSVRRDAAGAWALVLRLEATKEPVKRLEVAVQAVTEFPGETLPRGLDALTLGTSDPALFSGYVRIEAAADLDATVAASSGLSPIEIEFAPGNLRGAVDPAAAEPRVFRFFGGGYTVQLDVQEADPEARQIVLRDFRLDGELGEQGAGFVLETTAHVKNPKGGRIVLLAGGCALTELGTNPDWRPAFRDGALWIEFEKAGEYPLRLRFDAAVTETDGWSAVDFRVATAALQPVTLRGLKPDTEFRFEGAARPERAGDQFVSHLPPGGQVQLAWKEARPEAEGRLFYATEGFQQITISPGLLRQTMLLEFKVMQGELERLTLLVEGDGEVTRVQGAPVLAWKVVDGGATGARRLEVQFNQAQKDQFALQIQTQHSLGAFPLAVGATRIHPTDATRFGGYVRIVNDGAVRLEVVQSRGLSQISPEQLPQTPVTQSLLPAGAGQAFAFRFSGADFDLEVQADNILPELSVSEVLAYHLGETELSIDGELELDIREAPIRELSIRVPNGFAVAGLNVANLADYTVNPEPGSTNTALLRLTFGGPVAGRQMFQFRLERNVSWDQPDWDLPVVEVLKTKSTRGHVGISADAGFRLTPASTRNLTELATAFFPKKVTNLQAAFRLSEPAWQAAVRIDRLPQSIQADVFHLFSVGEAVAYGSSVMNFVISGAPVSTFRVDLSAEYFNVEFTGKDIRNWQKVNGGFEIHLHTPVAGDYTLLATYERPFKPQGETLTFTGARPLDAQTEQGYAIVISTFQFQVEPANVSSGLLAVEPAEVPAAYQLFFDAPILAAYRYTARPFNLALALKPLTQAETLQQVVDRAVINTRISEEGQVLTTVQYFVKNKGQPHLRMVVPEDTELWEATVDGSKVIPVRDGKANLVQLPQTTDPNTVHKIQLQLAAKSRQPARITVTAPAVMAPVLLTEWDLTPDGNRRLEFRGGSLTPTEVTGDISGFAGLRQFLHGPRGGDRQMSLLIGLALFGIAAVIWRWAGGGGATRYSLRQLLGGIVGLVAAVIGAFVIADLYDAARRISLSLPTALRFVAPVQDAGSALRLEVGNRPVEASFFWLAWRAWPAVIGLACGLAGLASGPGFTRRAGFAAAWAGLFWTALRWPNGAGVLFSLLLVFLFVQVVLPSLSALLRAPRKSGPDQPAAAAGAVALGLALLLGGIPTGEAAGTRTSPASGLAESVLQTARVAEGFVQVAVEVRWQAEEGDVLPLLNAPGVLTKIDLPAAGLRLLPATTPQGTRQQVLADRAGLYEFTFACQTRVEEAAGESGFHLPVQFGLINRLTLELVELEVDVHSPQAVRVTRIESSTSKNTRVELVLGAVPDAWIAWKPLSRDTRKEKAVFYAESFQLLVPTAGIVEGVHVVQVRPAQGELAEMTFTVPEGATITDVLTPALSYWRFDPDQRLLRVSLNPAQSRPFTLTIGSQIATTPLPYEQAAGLIAVNQAAGQVGLVGVATGPEVQLDDVVAGPLSTINLDDFPGSVLDSLRGRVPGLTLRRAFRYADPAARLTIAANAVEPDIRVVAQQTLSLGEDRSLLAAALEVTVSRAGIFKLSFVLPAGLDVESISGGALSHWTELKTDDERVITLHLKGRTEGRQRFDVSLTGPGVKGANGWPVPRLALREAAKQQGQLVVVPEQGMRLQAVTRDGVTPLDPAAVGTRQKSALAFRLLNADWQLTLDIEQLDSWIQVNSFQQVAVQEGQARVTANLDYQIENTGIRALRLRLPAAAENVRFSGPLMTDFLPVTGSVTNATQLWEVKLERRVIGGQSLTLVYTLRVPENTDRLVVSGVQAEEVNVQRGFLATQAGGRLQLRLDQVPETLLPADWEAVPAALRRDLATTSASHVFRLVDSDFQLPLTILRHEAASVLPARVERLELTSVISDAGVMLTRGHLELLPGDKRLLQLRVPKEAEFWFAFVNQGGVWLWREGEDILIPLQQAAVTGGNSVVEFYYTTRAGRASTRRLDLDLHGPRLDLPLQQITWKVYLDPKWELADWGGTMQLQDQGAAVQVQQVDVQAYLDNEQSQLRSKSAVARQNFEFGNSLILKGDVQNARRFLQNAYQLSQHDDAFNEDARVQLKNLKTEQALIGLNVNRGLAQGGQAVAQQPAQVELQQVIDNNANYTREQARAINESLSAEDQASLGRLAERIVEQQDAAVANPTAIRATIPEQGRVLTFTRSLQVDKMSDLSIAIEATAVSASSWGMRFTTVIALFIVALAFTLLPRPRD